MNNSDTNPLTDSLIYATSMPLSWSVREDGYHESHYIRVAEHNEHVLRCVNLLGEQHRDKVEEESESDLTLMRLEAKINMLLEMVSKLDQRINQIPESSEVKLASAGIEWLCCDSPPAVGSSIWIKLHIDHRIPEAMNIPAQVIAVREESDGLIVAAKFESIGEVVQEQVEKMIFRHHRRMIAQLRVE
ncbi:MAG: hypothetical protein GY814_13565 [Gammaproteobacteria bacterium]|nr:hypothetical protein [Gammaproteobacteria bacterium]